MKKAKAFLNVLKYRANVKLKRTVVRNYPVGAVIEPTSFCNLRCPSCPTGLQLGLRPTASMDEGLFRSAIDEIGDYVFELHFYNWGEPLLHRRTPEMIRYAKEKDIRITVSTNLSMTLTDDYIERLVLSGLDILIVALDGTTAETYAKYRRRGNFARVRENMLRISQAKERLGATSPRVVWQFLAFRHNEHEIDDARKLYKMWGADGVNIAPAMMPQDEHNDGLEPATDTAFNWYDPDSRIQTKSVALVNSGRSCSWLYGALVLNPGGRVSPCCGAAAEEHDFGEYSAKADFSALWNNPKFRQARNYFANRKRVDAGLSRLSSEDAHLIDGMAAGLAKEIARDEIICQKCPIPHLTDFVEPFIERVALDLAKDFVGSNSLRRKSRALLHYLLMGAPNWTAVWGQLKADLKARLGSKFKRKRGLRFRLGEEIDFANPSAASATQGGWGATDTWGIWTTGGSADLLLRPDRASARPLVIRAYLQPFLTQTHRRLNVAVSADDHPVGRWHFDIDAPSSGGPRWCEAVIPPDAERRLIRINFAADKPTSPLSEGLSGDDRRLGVFLIKLEITEYPMQAEAPLAKVA